MPHVEEIKNLLESTDLKFIDIAARVGVSSRTVQNINNGITHKEAGREYPIRITGRSFGELKARLLTPTTAAVPRPNVLSPQLLDYISMLSLLGVSIDCLLEFDMVYRKPLEEIFEKSLTKRELLAIIHLRPTVPNQLNRLIRAYDNPSVRFLNIEFWIKTGFITKREKEIIYSLFK